MVNLWKHGRAYGHGQEGRTLQHNAGKRGKQDNNKPDFLQNIWFVGFPKSISHLRATPTFEIKLCVMAPPSLSEARMYYRGTSVKLQEISAVF